MLKHMTDPYLRDALKHLEVCPACGGAFRQRMRLALHALDQELAAARGVTAAAEAEATAGAKKKKGDLVAR